MHKIVRQTTRILIRILLNKKFGNIKQNRAFIDETYDERYVSNYRRKK